MGASNIYITFESGNTLTAYADASQAKGTFLNLNKNTIASATDPEDVTFEAAEIIKDVIFSAGSGAVEIVRNDNPTKKILFAATNQASSASRQIHKIGLFAGAKYRLQVVSDFPA